MPIQEKHIAKLKVGKNNVVGTPTQGEINNVMGIECWVGGY